ncbi:MAG: endonuclease/exonuclease/phosphatase family protein [Muribaculaceae bacterium]
MITNINPPADMNHVYLHIVWTALMLTCISCRSQRNVVQPSNANVTVASFNMRCQVPEDDPSNNWNYRRHRIARFIESRGIDVVASQEMVGNQDSSLLVLLPHYGVVRGADGVNAIFYRQTVMEVIRQGSFALSETPEVIGSKGWDGAFPRLALWAVMRHRTSGREFVIVNTHLDHIGAIARREGAKLIVGRLPEIANGLPVVVTGDFNTDSTGDAYKTLSAALTDAHMCAQKRIGASYTWHNFGRLPMNERSIIDFVMVSRSIAVDQSEVPHECVGAMLSDHNPVIVTLLLH